MAGERDDRVLAPTRWVAIAIVPVLGAAFVILYLFPGRTQALWAWTIQPPMTPVFMGAGYLAGAWFFVRTATATQGHRVTKGLLAVSVFTTMLLVATLLHWDRFNHDHVSFWAWLALYIATPLLLPLLWFNNTRTDPGRPAPDDVIVPTWLRVLTAAAGVVVLGFAIAMFVRPSLFLDDWPWMLTPLTARTLASFFAFPAVAWALFAVDARWSSFRIPMETSIVGLVMILIGSIRRWDDFRSTGDARVYVATLAVALVWLCGVYLAMERRSPGRTSGVARGQQS